MLKSVAILASGTVVAQVVLILSTPIISRLFSIESFGILSIFVSVGVFLAAISGGKYELAIGLPKNDRHAHIVYSLVMHISLFMVFFYFLTIFLGKEFFKIDGIAYLLPIYVLLVAIYSSQSYLYQRYKRYKNISIALLIQSIVNTMFCILFGLLKIENGLIYSLLLGFLASILYFLLCNLRWFNVIPLSTKHIVFAKKYRSFPRYTMISDLSLLATQYFLPIVLGIVYNSTIVGLFAMANRIIRVPNIIGTSAIGNIFRNEAIDMVRDNGNCYKLYMRTFKKLLIISVIVYTTLFIMSPTVFPFFLGEEWREAGSFAQILVISLMVEFITIPLNSVFIIMNKQKQLMNIQVFMAIVSIVLVWVTAVIFEEPYVSLGVLVAVSVVFNVIQLIYSFKYSKGVSLC